MITDSSPFFNSWCCSKLRGKRYKLEKEESCPTVYWQRLTYLLHCVPLASFQVQYTLRKLMLRSLPERGEKAFVILNIRNFQCCQLSRFCPKSCSILSLDSFALSPRSWGHNHMRLSFQLINFQPQMWTKAGKSEFYESCKTNNMPDIIIFRKLMVLTQTHFWNLTLLLGAWGWQYWFLPENEVNACHTLLPTQGTCITLETVHSKEPINLLHCRQKIWQQVIPSLHKLNMLLHQCS